MKLYKVVIEEYFSVMDYLVENEPIENDRIIIDREKFQSLIGKYNYMRFKDKTKIYKDLNFLIHDKNNYTMPYKDPVLKRTVRKVILNYKTYETVKHLFETNITL